MYFTLYRQSVSLKTPDWPSSFASSTRGRIILFANCLRLSRCAPFSLLKCRVISFSSTVVNLSRYCVHTLGTGTTYEKFVLPVVRTFSGALKVSNNLEVRVKRTATGITHLLKPTKEVTSFNVCNAYQ